MGRGDDSTEAEATRGRQRKEEYRDKLKANVGESSGSRRVGGWGFPVGCFPPSGVFPPWCLGAAPLRFFCRALLHSFLCLMCSLFSGVPAPGRPPGLRQDVYYVCTGMGHATPGNAVQSINQVSTIYATSSEQAGLTQRVSNVAARRRGLIAGFFERDVCHLFIYILIWILLFTHHTPKINIIKYHTYVVHSHNQLGGLLPCWVRASHSQQLILPFPAVS